MSTVCMSTSNRTSTHTRVGFITEYVPAVGLTSPCKIPLFGVQHWVKFTFQISRLFKCFLKNWLINQTWNAPEAVMGHFSTTW